MPQEKAVGPVTPQAKAVRSGAGDAASKGSAGGAASQGSGAG